MSDEEEEEEDAEEEKQENSDNKKIFSLQFTESHNFVPRTNNQVI